MRIISEALRPLTPDMMYSRRELVRLTAPRTPGVHEGAVLKYLAQGAGKLSSDDDSPFEAFTDTHYPLMPALGVMWEEFVASLEHEMLWQPGEWVKDEIYGTPDGMKFGDPFNICEMKQTTKKLQSIATCWMYLHQGLNYCAMSDTSEWGRVRRVEYHICWLLGDYSRPYQPRYTVSMVEFNDAEVKEWWKLMLAVKHNVQPEGIQKT
jgi:hypothetical protein